jgi:hypothetical protein
LSMFISEPPQRWGQQAFLTGQFICNIPHRGYYGMA